MTDFNVTHVRDHLADSIPIELKNGVKGNLDRSTYLFAVLGRRDGFLNMFRHPIIERRALVALLHELADSLEREADDAGDPPWKGNPNG